MPSASVTQGQGWGQILKPPSEPLPPRHSTINLPMHPEHFFGLNKYSVLKPFVTPSPEGNGFTPSTCFIPSGPAHLAGVGYTVSHETAAETFGGRAVNRDTSVPWALAGGAGAASFGKTPWDKRLLLCVGRKHT